MEAQGAAALVSTSSVYFSLPEDGVKRDFLRMAQEARVNCRVLDFDRQWAGDPGVR